MKKGININIDKKAALLIATIVGAYSFADFVSVIDTKSTGGINVTGGISDTELTEALDALKAEIQADYDAKIADLEAAAMEDLPIGTVAMWGNSTPPTGWIEMRGQSITSYSELSAIYGSTLPDLRGEFVRGWDNGRGVDSESSRNINSWQMASHVVHDNDGLHVHNFSDGTSATSHGLEAATKTTDSKQSWSSATGTNHTYTSASDLQRFTSTVKPRNIALMYIVKAE